MKLTVDRLACRRGGRIVFANLSFSLGSGEALLVTGRNGAGKSTLLSAIAGLVPLERGAISVEGLGEAGIAECIHLVGHRDALKAAFTARENLAFAAALLGTPRLDPAAALARFGLAGAADVQVAFLSAGQRRRVALARLLVAHRPLWLLDEPGNALDAAAQALLATLVAEHRQGGGAVLAATHAPLDLPGASELRLDGAKPSAGPSELVW